MVLPFLFALVYLLLSVRILVDVRIAVSEARKGVSITLRTWGICLCLDMPIRLTAPQGDVRAQAGKAKQVWPLVRAAIRAISWGQTDIRMRIGTRDASLTAMIAGSTRAAGAALQAVAGQRFPCEIEAEPVFRAPCFALSGRCIFSLVPGDIMFAVARAAAKKTQREGFSWLSIPLKA